MENKHPFFRQNVINNRIHRSLGTVRMNIPLNYRVAGYVAAALVFVLLLFFYFAQISERTLVRGYGYRKWYYFCGIERFRFN